MKLSSLAEKTGLKILTSAEMNPEIETGYTSDLLSDVMANAEEGSVLITIQAHKNSVAVASQFDLPAIIICNGRSVPQEVIDTAEGEGIAIALTKDNQFEISYKIKKAIIENAL